MGICIVISGGIVSIYFHPNDTNTYMTKLPTPNPYYTKDLGPDEYLGKVLNSTTVSFHVLILK